mmetsp:Transcript_4705/g.7285  ORF Transcript_4705/g.7285 Transcript_4705/m.7285 type:complete len:615 (+) Transcript_4705:423-2267(+)
MSTFVQAMDANAKQLGENGSPEFRADGSGDPRVAAFFAFVRGIESERVSELLDQVLEKKKPEMVADLFIMAFQTRNCRGGKGERDIFVQIMLHLYKEYPDTITELLSLTPEYGCFRDWFQIVSFLKANGHKDHPLTNRIMELAAEQLKTDQQNLSRKEPISLLAKWAPREKRSLDYQARALAKEIFPNSKTSLKDYRCLVASLNKKLDTTETYMCSNQWDKIKFSSVPSRAMMQYRKAFLNEKVGSVPSTAEEETGNRFPENEDRVQCRKRLREEVLNQKASKLKGKQLFPHEIVEKFMTLNYGYCQKKPLSVLEKDILQRQWEDIRDNVRETMAERQVSQEKEDVANKVDLGNLVAIADVSGSMSGTPLTVCVALSILVSELAAPEFSNRFLTFSERPTWVHLENGMPLADKVAKTERANWGMNTDFALAMDLILETAISAKLKPEEIPNLIVFSDMQFDQARVRGGPSWETQHERLVRKYEEAGKKACGLPWSPPQIIYWNLRNGRGCGLPAQANIEGVTMLSGYSPSLMKLLLSGENIFEQEVIREEIDENGDVVLVKEKVKKTPYDTFREALDDTAYDKVREVLGRSNEGLLACYDFEPVLDSADNGWVM